MIRTGIILVLATAAGAVAMPGDARAQAGGLSPASAGGQDCRTLIAFSSDRTEAPGIYVIDPDGGDPELVASVPGALQVEWSPDGKRIGFLSVTSEDEELFEPFSALRFHAFLYTVKPDGSDLVRHGTYPISMGFSWSPDGRRVAFASALETGGATSIYVAELDGGAWQKLTDVEGNYMFPEWSADGEMIAFAARRGDKTSLRVVTPDGREEKAVVEVSGSRAFRMFRPVWAPAGRMVAFAEGRAVFIVNTVEGEPQQIATGPGEPHGWSPGQRYVLLGEGAEGRGRVFVIDLDTLEEKTLASDAGVGGASSPSPRWDRVAYTAIPNEQADVFIVGMDGGPAVNLTDHPANDYFPTWSPCLGGG
ncbi:MAG: hypothetical protein P8Y26_11640 [Gemmatimonadales bacterium]